LHAHCVIQPIVLGF